MCLPRIWSATRRALRGATRTYLAVARTTGARDRLRGLLAWLFRRFRAFARLSLGFFRAFFGRFFGRRFGGFFGSGFRRFFRRRFFRVVFFWRPRQSLAAGVGAEGAGRGELAQLVTDHRLGDEDRHVLAAVVDGDRVTDHLREDRRGRDQVLTICFFPASFIASMRPIRRSSTNGPFLVDLPIIYCPSSSRDDGRARCNGWTACPSCGCGSRASACPTG